MNILELLGEANEKIPSTGFHTDMEKATISNNNFRKVLFTASGIQLVVMSLKPNEDIGLETHGDTDQFIRVDNGSGKAIIDGKEYKLKDGSAIIVPRGSSHNITAGTNGIKLYTIYSPPHHEDGTVHSTKKEAEEKEHEA